ncbi:MAG TPA: Mrp/NBP35 family ATP-binding protein, partial [Planctomycetota bacterium]|nr:Mrp/NBP35 family ATP-binding protein [Planctomycetota bacterium]
KVQDPDLKRDVVSLGEIRDLKVEGGAASFVLVLPTPAHPSRDRLRADVEAAVRATPGVASVAATVRAEVRGTATSGPSATPSVKNLIAVGSGKGGVGKSTVAANLAAGLARLGAKTGLLDADIYGPSIPLMFGCDPAEKPTVAERGGRRLMNPVEAHGVKLISMGFLVDPDKPVVWRGPMLHGALRQFFGEVAWDDLDYLIIDLPPGTGDVALTMAQTVTLTGAVVVSTPQNVALIDAKKALAMFQQTNIPILGLVENMTGPVFGAGGVRAWAAAQGHRFLGELPLSPGVRESGDRGAPAALSADPAVSGPYLRLAEQVAIAAAARNLDAPQRRPISLDAPAPGSMEV